MFQSLQKKKRKIEHCDCIPVQDHDSPKCVNDSKAMNSAGHLKQKIEVKI